MVVLFTNKQHCHWVIGLRTLSRDERRFARCPHAALLGLSGASTTTMPSLYFVRAVLWTVIPAFQVCKPRKNNSDHG
jgi:hypothetical protein